MDNNLFQNIYGPAGQIVAISSEGTMPCSKSDWAKAVSWSFTSNFPTLDEQNALENGKEAVDCRRGQISRSRSRSQARED